MKAALAFSGGLDTSITVPLLKEEYGYEQVLTVTLDVGQPQKELKKAKEKAEKLETKHFEIDAVDEYAEKFLAQLIKTNASYEGYVLGTAIARPIIAEKVVEVAKENEANALVHGCTGRGNDQFRFENVYRSLMPEAKIIAPIREKNLTRKKEINLAKKYGVKVEATKEKPWSVDENLWNRSIEGGFLEDPRNKPPEEIFEWTRPEKNAPEKTEDISLSFNEGTPSKINGERKTLAKIIKTLNKKAGRFGIGRTDMMENRILGFKARENYEHPAATILYTAHQDLEKLVLTRRQTKFKSLIEEEFSELVYNGLVYEPLYTDLLKFIDSTQKKVTGKVELRLEKGRAMPLKRDSPNSLYSEELASFDSKKEQETAEGAVRFHGFQTHKTDKKT